VPEIDGTELGRLCLIELTHIAASSAIERRESAGQSIGYQDLPQIGGNAGLMPQIGGTCLTFDGNGQPAHWSRDELTVMCVRSAQWGALRFTSLTSIMFHYPSQHNDRCNLLGSDSVDLNDIRFVRF